MSLLLALQGGAGIVEATGSSAGIATVTGISAATASVVASTGGFATVTGIGAAIAPTVAASDGLATVSGLAAAFFAAIGNADGVSVVDGIPVGGTPFESTGSAAGTSAVDGVSQIVVQVSSGIHRLRNAQLAKKPFVSIDWRDGFEEGQPAVPEIAPDVHGLALTETDREIQSLLQVAIDREIATEQARPTPGLERVEQEEVLRKKRNEALIWLLMAA